jgi:hypothetical protein
MRFIRIALATVTLAAGAWWLTPASPDRPAPTEIGGEEDGDRARRRVEWIESLHRHEPGLDWRALDAATRAQKREARALNPEAPFAVPAGTWRERGARNQTGRVSDVDYDPATDRLTAFAHGGQLWRSLKANLAWQPLNDARQFNSPGNVQNFQRMAGSVGVPERWVAADDTNGDMYYSDNQGASWSPSGGYQPANWGGVTYVAARDVAGTQVYVLVRDYDVAASAWKVRLLRSNDRGATFADLGFRGAPEKVALFALGQGSNKVYLMVGKQIYRVETNDVLTAVTNVYLFVDAQTADEKVGLTGGIFNGTPYFFAFFERAGVTRVFRALSAENADTWAHMSVLGAPIPATSYLRMAVGTPTNDPNYVFFGSVNLFRSTNGGKTFTAVNDWSDYYANVANKLHADISFVKAYPNLILIGTDGGLYQSTDNLATVTNLTLSGMRQAQYYDSYTRRTPPYSLSIGAQDQGYQRAARPATAIASYTQAISGDYAHLTSSDGGATVWMNYPGFTLIDPGAATNAPILPTWDFGNATLQNTLFLPPLSADPGNSKVAWLGGGASTNGPNHVVRLTWSGAMQASGAISHQEGTYDFGGQITALAHSPQNPALRFAMANVDATGTAAFFTSTTPLANWTKTVTTLPQGQFFYGTTITPDRARANTLYVAGAGYSGPAVYVSVNNGQSFLPMSTGLPNTLVYNLAISPDGNKLFAATEVGPYYFDRATSTWVDIGNGAPDNVYWHVDYVPALNTARFSTYGRGIWDYDMGGGDLLFRYGTE